MGVKRIQIGTILAAYLCPMIRHRGHPYCRETDHLHDLE